jgi:uncharacterized protein with HEPN domain
MNARQPDEWLADIVAWGERLADHVDGMTFQEFAADPKTQDAASKCVESIGLAAKEVSRLNPLLDSIHPDLKLSQAYRARNKLSHGYYAIQLDILWQTAIEAIPKTVAAARAAQKTAG